MLWLVFALLIVATVAVLLRPLLRATPAAPARAAFDLAVYRNQLAEVVADVARGLVPADQADATRLEIQRRMLAAGGEAPASSSHRQARATAAIVIALVIPLGAGLLYASRGSPELPDQPYAPRLEHDPAVILADAAAKLEVQLAAQPSAAGYLHLAQIYALQRDYDGAMPAYRRAILFGANDAETWGKYGESIVLAGGGAVAPQALEAFARALTLDQREPRARYYAGMAELQIGNTKAAVAIWRDLENDSKADAPWLPELRDDIEAAAKSGGFASSSVPPAAPSAASLGAAVEAMKKAMGTP